MLGGDAPYQFHYYDGLADSCASEEPDLASSGVRGQEVDDLDPGLQRRGPGDPFGEPGGMPVDGEPGPRVGQCSLTVDGLAEHVDHPAQELPADGHGYGSARIIRRQTPPETVSRAHRDAAHHAVANVESDLQHE